MTSRRARIALLATIALIIPLRAAAAGDAAATLGVSASLNHCGTSSSGIVCRVDVGFNAIPGAEYYTASVTLADASVRSFGTVGNGGGALWVPYVGSGTYYVEITAWGTDPDGKPEEIEVDTGTVENTDKDLTKPEKPDKQPAPADQPPAESPEEPDLPSEEPAVEEAPAEPTPEPTTPDPILNEPPSTPSPSSCATPPTEATAPAAGCPAAAPQSEPAPVPAE